MEVFVEIFTIIVFCSEISFFTCVSYHFQHKNYVCKEFLCDLSTTDNVLKIAECGSSKKILFARVMCITATCF